VLNPFTATPFNFEARIVYLKHAPQQRVGRRQLSGKLNQPQREAVNTLGVKLE
jgi:hypothetical protein